MNPWSFSRRVGHLSYSKIEARLPPNMNPRVGAAAKMASRLIFHVFALGERKRAEMSNVGSWAASGHSRELPKLSRPSRIKGQCPNVRLLNLLSEA
jgi:hypothetical protein